MDAKLFFFIIAATLQLTITFLQSWGKIKDEKERLTTLGRSLLILSLVSFGIMLTLYVITDTQEVKYKNMVDERDSLHHLELLAAQDKSYQRLETSKMETIDALARYGLKYDTSQRIIQRMLDSTNKGTSLPDPIFEMCDITLRANLDSVIYTVVFCAKEASVYNPKLVVATYLLTENGKMQAGMAPKALVSSNHVIANKDERTLQYFIILPQGINYERTFFHLKGTIENSNRKRIRIDDIIQITHKDGEVGAPIADEENKVRAFIATRTPY